MKVLHLTNMWPSGESYAGIFVRNLVDALDARGVDNDVLLIDARKSRLSYVTVVPALFRKIKSARYDLIHAQYAHSVLLAHLQRRLPVVSQFHGEFHCTSILDIALAKLAVRMARHTIFVDPDSARKASNNGRAHTAVIPIGVDPAKFFPADRNAARQALGLSSAKRFVLFASDPERPEKDYPLFQATLSLIRERVPSVEGYILHGKDPSEVPAILNAVDLLLFTSKFEASPTVIKEALLCNLPIVATDVGDVKEALRGVSESVVCSRSPSNLAEAAVAALRPGARSNGWTKRDVLSIERTAKSVISFYEKTLEIDPRTPVVT